MQDKIDAMFRYWKMQTGRFTSEDYSAACSALIAKLQDDLHATEALIARQQKEYEDFCDEESENYRSGDHD